ncbi:flotillin-like FloA family protein [Carboxylicivirga mesophila]|uniref:Flotillin-like FloA family protein n=1 Tax=Carboxylicivirga mesophila TaxID=1166478 RepID=A0ABS5KE22_9BACT|nr:flotillin-like FloA family protein [Carboxylicivirga mesophila]MBS2212776.1 flotillin-like FloA family protein [Carboxylicivirga mesophila]
MYTPLITILIIAILLFILYYVPILLWFVARLSGAKINLLTLTFMRFRNVPPAVIVKSLIEVNKAGLKGIDRKVLEAHYLAGGNIENLVHGIIIANKAGRTLTVEKTCKDDLAAIDLTEAFNDVKHAGDDEVI